MSDGQHEPGNAVDGNDQTYWASAFGPTEQVFTVYLKELKTANEITIKWKYPPSKCDVLVLKSF